MEKISKNHEAIKKIKDIIKTNNYPHLTIVDDLQIFKIVDAYNLKIDTLLYSYDKEYHPDTKILLDALCKQAKYVYEISSQLYSSLSLKENHVGFMASVELPKFQLDDFKEKNFVFVLDRLELPGNIGTIYRTLDAVSIDGILLVDEISKYHNPKLTQASRGCNLIIPTISTSYEIAQKWLLENGYTVYLGEPSLGQDYQNYTYQGKIAIVVGNERFGINEKWYANPHKKVYIPMEGNQNSLNVGVAASILVYEAFMKRKKSL